MLCNLSWIRPIVISVSVVLFCLAVGVAQDLAQVNLAHWHWAQLLILTPSIFFYRATGSGSVSLSYRHLIVALAATPTAFFTFLSSPAQSWDTRGLFWTSVDSHILWSASDYTALESNTFRLLRIHAGRPDGFLRASVEIFGFRHAPPYDALSYSWSDRSGAIRGKSILLDNKLFPVSESVWSAIEGVRLEQGETYIWIDSVCIDQSNIQDKNQQIPYMPIIYRTARKVITWLGVHALPDWLLDAYNGNWDPEWSTQAAASDWSRTEIFLRGLILEPYWQRCWIIQEIAHARNIEVLLVRDSRLLTGSRSQFLIPWQTFITLVKVYESKTPYVRDAIARILRLDELKTMRMSSHLYLLDSLIEFQQCFSTVGLDKIYSLLSIVQECYNGCVIVDYNKSSYEVYYDLIQHRSHAFVDPESNGIEVPYFASLVRSLLSRRDFTVPSPIVPLQRQLWHPVSLGARLCSSNICRSSPLGICIEILGLHEADEVPHVSFMWEPTGPESVKQWLPRDMMEVGPEEEYNPNFIPARAVRIGTVHYISKVSLNSFLDSSNGARDLTVELLEYLYFEQIAKVDMSNAKSEKLQIIYMVHAIEAVLLSNNAFRIRNFIDFADYESTRQRTEEQASYLSEPLFFLGRHHNEIFVGLGPETLTVGDILLQFWNMDTVLMARKEEEILIQQGLSPEIYGRGGIVRYEEQGSPDWHKITERAQFQDYRVGTAMVDLYLDLKTLTMLSLDSCILPDEQGRFNEDVPRESWYLDL